MSYPLRLDRALWMVCAFSWDKRQIHLCLILEQRMGGHHFSDCHPRILFSPFFHFLKSPPSFTLRLSATLALSLSSILLRLSSLRGFFFLLCFCRLTCDTLLFYQLPTQTNMSPTASCFHCPSPRLLWLLYLAFLTSDLA